MLPAADNLNMPVLIAIGLALFLFGMRQLESGVRALGYNTFKRWLSSSTASPVGSAATGVAVTAILQSSSLVSLLVLAFASAGALPLYNAVGVLLGANLGTTITGWMVATIGFKLSLQAFALPMMAIGAVLQLLAERRAGLRGLGIILFGLGLVIFGLDIMKDTVADLPRHWDLAVLQGHGPWLYFLVGVCIAALIQSSSATMMITLTALNAGLLDLSAAAALVIGADLGTTSTTALGSIGGHHIKRQLALAHFLFNVIVDFGAFFLLLPILPMLLALFALEDPLYNLVAFHSLFNLLGLLAFLPLLKPFSHWIGGRFLSQADTQRPLVGQPTAVPDAALVATNRVLESMRLNAVMLNLHGFHITPEQLQPGPELQEKLQACFDQHLNTEQRYQQLKRQESDLLAFSFDLQAERLDPDQAALLQHQIHQARALVYSSKTLNGIRENIIGMRHNHQHAVVELYHQHRSMVRSLYRRYLALATQEALTDTGREILADLLSENEAHYLDANQRVHTMAAEDMVSGSELSTMLNVNREIHHGLKNLLRSIG